MQNKFFQLFDISFLLLCLVHLHLLQTSKCLTCFCYLFKFSMFSVIVFFSFSFLFNLLLKIVLLKCFLNWRWGKFIFPRSCLLASIDLGFISSTLCVRQQCYDVDAKCPSKASCAQGRDLWKVSGPWEHGHHQWGEILVSSPVEWATGTWGSGEQVLPG